MPRRQRNQPVLACARCYSLKKKCDKKLPCCSRCSLAGKECAGINRHSRKEIPRRCFHCSDLFTFRRAAVFEKATG
uniref:Zn(2)-C6 fungal-type domain-containing protein n=1 Tax=Bionectria ochroleuca TaxID=29856 RepID=A0A0B7KK86_BIOOC